MQLALFQPDIAGNVGTTLRSCACLGVPLHIIEPCAFPLSDAALRRAGMDYAERAQVARHAEWAAFAAWAATAGGRVVLMTTKGATRIDHFAFTPRDIILMGAESAGVPDAVHAAADARVMIPQTAGTRSLNVAVAAGIALAEALRQTGGFPP